MEFVPAYALSKGLLKQRKGKPVCIVIHTTGAGPWRRWKAAGTGEPFDHALRVYTKLYRYCPHVVISGETGRAVRVVPDSYVAMHVGSAGHRQYTLSTRVPSWWSSDFPLLKSPLELAGGQAWSSHSVNRVSFGIEVSPPKQGSRAPWSEHTYKSLAGIVGEWASEYGIPLDSQYIVTHSEVHPLYRTTKSGKPWDPSPGQFDKTKLLALVAQMANPAAT